MKIQKARLEDAKEISELKKNTIEKINKEYNRKQIAVLKKDYSVKNIIKDIEERKMFCLINNNEILGIVSLKENGIGGLFIRSDLIRKGFGKKLLSFIENYAKKKSINKVWLYSTPYALGFYKKLGYKIIEKGTRIHNGVKFPEVKFEKKLK